MFVQGTSLCALHGREDDDVKPKLLFWPALVLAVIGGQVPEGNLYYFFAVQLLVAGVGSALHRREKRRRVATPPAPKPS
jgi:hypothetical protein